MTPPRPAEFHPEVPPPGFELNLISFWQERPIITPRLQLVHTNGASREGSIESAKRHAELGGGNTIPHCQIDRSGRGALLLPSNRKGIANYRAADFSLGFETADTGYLADPTISAFTEPQAESVAVAVAYYAVLHGIPLSYPTAWDGSGTASHTEPFGYPYWTNSSGKICPGLKKKAQVRDLILPRAREIVAAWTGATPTPTPPAPTTTQGVLDMVIVARDTTGPTIWFSPNGGLTRHAIRNMEQLNFLLKPGAIDAATGNRVTTWQQCTPLTPAQLDHYIGRAA